MKQIIRIIFAISILSLVFSCDTDGSGNIPDIGYLELSITDAPIDASNVKSVWITITEIKYQKNNEWQSTGLLPSPITVDLLTLTHGSTYDFSQIPLSVGTYSNIRFSLDILEEGTSGESNCYIEFNDGSSSPLFVPSGDQTGYKAIGSFDITKDGITGITVDFNLRKMVVKKGNGDYLLKPVLRMVDNGNVGSVTVPVDEGLTCNNVIVFAYEDGTYSSTEVADPPDGEARFPNAVNSVNADTDGNYTLPFLPASTYDLVLACYSDETFVEVIKIIEDVVISSGEDLIIYGVGNIGPAGGIVVYDDEADNTDDISGYRYLEVAPYGWYLNGDDPQIVWGDDSVYLSNTELSVGSGQSNTQKIITALGDGDYAATICINQNINGYDDWFLPSEQELLLAHQILFLNDLGGFTPGNYWSSSEIITLSARSINFWDGVNNGNFVTTAKSSPQPRVRPVRYF